MSQQATIMQDAPSIQTLPSLQEYRCGCGKLLFKGLVLKGVVEVKCKRCQSIKRLTLL